MKVRRVREVGLRRAGVLLAAGALVAVGVAGCATTPSALPTAPGRSPGTSGGSAAPGGGKVAVVAAENFWGSLASQLGGEHAAVTSVIINPDTDPHDYEPTPADGRAVATAQYVIDNGIGYDPWAAKLAAANPSPHRVVLTVGDLVGVSDGGNPHQWYSPDSVTKVIDQMTADYQRLDPGDAAYFDQQKQALRTQGLARYTGLIAQIKARYGGTPIGASESIVTPLAQGLGLNLITPQAFLNAISEGSDPTAADKATVDEQIRTRAIKVYLYNSQNSTPDVQAQVAEAQAAGIPVATVTETLTPAQASFQDWQADQLQRLAAALAQATGR